MHLHPPRQAVPSQAPEEQEDLLLVRGRVPMNMKQKLAVLDAILALNATLIGEPQRVFVTVAPKGWVRIGTRHPLKVEARHYPNIDVALETAWQALERAKAAAK